MKNKPFNWSEEKNNILIAQRGVGFEEVVIAIQNGHLLGVVKGKEPKYAHQRIFVVLIDGYTYAIPFIEDEKEIFLKTIYPSRVLHQQYQREISIK